MGRKIRTFEKHLEAAEKMLLWICTKGAEWGAKNCLGQNRNETNLRGSTPELVTGCLRKHQKWRSHSRMTLGRRCPGEKGHGEGSGGALLGPLLLNSLSSWCTVESYFPRCPSLSTSTHKLTCAFGYSFPSKYKCFSVTAGAPSDIERKAVSGWLWPLLPCSHIETEGCTSLFPFSIILGPV